MHNPLSLLFPELLEKLMEEGFKFFVRQSYARGLSPNIREAFLVTHYREFHEANAHFQSIRFDARKYLYSMGNAEEKARLLKAAGQPEGYQVYTALLKSRSWRPPPDLGPRVKAYLRSNGMAGNRNIGITLSIQFGELILNIQAGMETYRLPLAEFEKT